MKQFLDDLGTFFTAVLVVGFPFVLRILLAFTGR